MLASSSGSDGSAENVKAKAADSEGEEDGCVGGKSRDETDAVAVSGEAGGVTAATRRWGSTGDLGCTAGGGEGTNGEAGLTGCDAQPGHWWMGGAALVGVDGCEWHCRLLGCAARCCAGVTEMRMPATAGMEQPVSGDESAGDEGGVLPRGGGRSAVLMNS